MNPKSEDLQLFNFHHWEVDVSCLCHPNGAGAPKNSAEKIITSVKLGTAIVYHHIHDTSHWEHSKFVGHIGFRRAEALPQFVEVG